MCYFKHFSDLFCKLSMQKLQFDVNMPIMLHVPYSTHLCRKIQARTKETIKNAKFNSPQRVELATTKKLQKVPGFLAFNMPTANQKRASSPHRAQSKKTPESPDILKANSQTTSSTRQNKLKNVR